MQKTSIGNLHTILDTNDLSHSGHIRLLKENKGFNCMLKVTDIKPVSLECVECRIL